MPDSCQCNRLSEKLSVSGGCVYTIQIMWYFANKSEIVLTIEDYSPISDLCQGEGNIFIKKYL